jgi:hypothetical protein
MFGFTKRNVHHQKAKAVKIYVHFDIATLIRVSYPTVRLQCLTESFYSKFHF